MFEAWTDGLFPEIKPEAIRYLAASEMRLHPQVAGVYSSMAFAFNLFLPFRIAGRASLARILGNAISRTVEVEGVEFEFHGRADTLGEWTQVDRPGPKDKFTASDVAVTVHDGNSRGVVLIEVKFSEGGFTDCGGRESRGNRDTEVCRSASVLMAEPNRCYLIHTKHAVRDRRYWDIFSRSAGTMASAFPNVDPNGQCPFAYDHQQLMRNHALALGLVQTGGA
jgi:hypothetical protein